MSTLASEGMAPLSAQMNEQLTGIGQSFVDGGAQLVLQL